MAYFAVALILLCFNFVKMDYDKEDFKLLYPLIGEWTTSDADLIENWEFRYPKMMSGEKILFKGDIEESREDINLVLDDRRIYYIPSVKGQKGKSVSFTLIEVNDKKFIFENKDNYFPQRIIYELISANSFDVILEGETGKGLKTIKHHFERKKEAQMDIDKDTGE